MTAEPRPASSGFLSLTSSGWARRIVDLIYPPVCVGCGVSTSTHVGFCPDCWRDVRFIERPYCEILGMPFSYDIGQGMLSAEAIANPPVFDRLRSVAVFEGAARNLVHALKYRDRTELAAMMAGWMLRAAEGHVAGCDAIIPVPLHRSRFFLRRFNQAAELARHISKQADKPFLHSTLIRVKRTSRQVGLSARAREDNVRAAFAVVKGRENEVFGKRIVLVDDVYTTGATVSAATRALKKAGATDVTVLSFAMAISGPI